MINKINLQKSKCWKSNIMKNIKLGLFSDFYVYHRRESTCFKNGILSFNVSSLNKKVFYSINKIKRFISIK